MRGIDPPDMRGMGRADRGELPEAATKRVYVYSFPCLGVASAAVNSGVGFGDRFAISRATCTTTIDMVYKGGKVLLENSPRVGSRVDTQSRNC